MPISFFPRAGQIFTCNFKGFVAPEMVKIRPVIVISPRLPGRSEIVAVVPISLTPPNKEYPFTVRLSKNYHPDEEDDLPCWAKCDMILNISKDRLSSFKVGRRKWHTPNASAEDLRAVKDGVIHGLGRGDLLSQ